uniref:Uncharacterized protein n=1 Tax=Cacopsylla melanoneura TaxID=428564 RepID=A0A8D8LZK5_9HEMI
MNKLCGASLPSPMTSLSNLVTLILSLSKSSLQANPVASFVVNYVRVNATTMTEGTKVLLYVVNTAALIIPGNLYHLVISCTSSLFRIKTGTSGLGFSFSGIRLQLPAEVS